MRINTYMFFIRCKALLRNVLQLKKALSTKDIARITGKKIYTSTQAKFLQKSSGNYKAIFKEFFEHFIFLSLSMIHENAPQVIWEEEMAY